MLAASPFKCHGACRRRPTPDWPAGRIGAPTYPPCKCPEGIEHQLLNAVGKVHFPQRLKVLFQRIEQFFHIAQFSSRGRIGAGEPLVGVPSRPHLDRTPCPGWRCLQDAGLVGFHPWTSSNKDRVLDRLGDVNAVARPMIGRVVRTLLRGDVGKCTKYLGSSGKCAK